MKKIFTTLLFAASFSVAVFAQVTFSPATSNIDGTYSYNFGEVVLKTEQKSIKFTISGLPSGKTYTALIVSWSFIDANNKINSENSLFKITDTTCGNYFIFNPFLATNSKGRDNVERTTISFTPQQMILESYSLNARTETNCPNYKDYFGEYTATVKIDVIDDIIVTPKLFRTANASYTLNLTGTSVATTTSIDFSVFDPSKTLAYPNPAKDILHVSGNAEIFDLVGNKVASGLNEINIEHLLSGIYVVKANGKSNKIVKE